MWNWDEHGGGGGNWRGYGDGDGGGGGWGIKGGDDGDGGDGGGDGEVSTASIACIHEEDPWIVGTGKSDRQVDTTKSIRVSRSELNRNWSRVGTWHMG